MKKIYTLLCFCILIIACKSKTSPEAKIVEDAITNVKTNPNDSTLLGLDTALTRYIELKGYNDSTTANLIVQAARVTAEINQPAAAVRYYNQYLSHYSTRPDQADKLIEAIASVEKLNKPELNQIAYKSFASRFPNDNRATDIQGRITAKEITIDSTLRYLGSAIFSDSSYRLDEDKTRLYIAACELAAAADPAFANAPEHLLRAAETARTIREMNHAIDIYDWIIDVYPNHPRAATSLFLKGFTYDNELKNFELAGQLYNDYLTRYPNDEYAESAKVLIQNLGKSDAEWIKLIEKKKGEEVQ